MAEPPSRQRNRRILALHDEGESLGRIAAEYDISRARNGAGSRSSTTLGSATRPGRLPRIPGPINTLHPADPIETWIASPPGAGDGALPTVVEVHGAPLGAWAPAPHLEGYLLAAHGPRPAARGYVEYVLYPEESHTVAASGRPDRRIDWMTRGVRTGLRAPVPSWFHSNT